MVHKLISEIRIDEILKLLPHRSPFLLVDWLKDVVPDESGIGYKNITIDEPFFQGHFPGKPIMPGVLQIEAMAQTASVIFLKSLPQKNQSGNHIYFMTINNVKFRKPVLPGDVLELHIHKESSLKNVHKFKGKAYVSGEVVSEATFSAMIEQERKIV